MSGTPSYVRGATATPLSGDTIGATLNEVASWPGTAAAVVARHQGVRLTYHELRAQADRIARGLLALDIAPGARIGIWSGNCVEWLVAHYAVAKIGAILVHLDPSQRAGELERTLNHAGVSVLITALRSRSTDHLAVLERVDVPTVRVRICLAPESIPGYRRWDDLASLGDTIEPGALPAREALVRCDQTASLLYTSGTTGSPKGVALSHHSLRNNAFFIGERLRLSSSDRVCLPVPLHHTFGYMLGALAALTHGSTVVLASETFDPAACLDAIDDEPCTAFYGVPAMFRAVLRHPGFAPDRVASLRTGIMAGGPCPVDLMREVVTTMHMPEVTICYGLTEGGTLYQSRPEDDVERRVTTAGVVHPHVECKVVDPVTHSIVPRGTAGELWARGYSTMTGYWHDDAATRDLVQQDGWLRTGDLVVMHDDGALNVVGRIKDVIVSAGRNISPREIEDALRTHPKVGDAAVVGVPDEVYGEAACAWVQPREGDALTADEVLRFCRERIAPHKVPRRVRLTSRLPLTASGKVQKFRLRQIAIQEFGLADLERLQTA